jgi:hypothetical protein
MTFRKLALENRSTELLIYQKINRLHELQRFERCEKNLSAWQSVDRIASSDVLTLAEFLSSELEWKHLH